MTIRSMIMDDCVASSSKLSLDSGAVEARNRTFVVAALIALAPIALAAADLPARRLQTAFLGSALTVTITADSLLIVLMPVLACSGADWLLRAHPEVRAGEIPFLFPFWIAPAFASLALAVLLTRIPNWPLWVLTLAFGTVLIVVILTAEYVGLSPGSRGYALSRLALTAVTYAIGFGLFTLVYSARERSVVSATLTFVIAAGLALDLLAPHIIGLRSAGAFALVTGLVCAQATWALNYWNVSNWSAGVLLLAVFYLLVGLAQQHVQDHISPMILVEFGVVLAVALFAAWQLAPVR
ncbi:MAG TPA: hypothetical protein PLQ83_03405 [Thermoflexales bacterium]|nr:hypothetical protein [Thermoflexales bacterium]